MAHSSLQVCMDTSDWLQGTMSEEISRGLDSSLSSPFGEGQPLMERRLRPPHDLNLKCPRCDSSHTKFCYYNNYSLTQPRYFCKACRRYWTKGGTLRNIPIGGGCRKNKKSSSKKPNNDHHHQIIGGGGGSGCGGGCSSAGMGLDSRSDNPNDIHLSFPQVQFPPHLAKLIGAQMSLGGGNFMENGLFRPIDFMEGKYEGLVGGNGVGYDFMGGDDDNGTYGSHEFGVIGGIIGDHHNVCDNNGGYNGLTSTFGGINVCSSTSPIGLSSTHDHTRSIIHDGKLGINFIDQRLLLPYDGNANNNHQNGVDDWKPKPKLMSLEWQDQGYNVNDTLSSWSGMMANRFLSSTTNSLF